MGELTIRPYQAKGLDFLVGHHKAALFDEPGLGKSMQALLAMRDLVPAPSRLLIVAPGDAIGVWRDEAEKWLDEVPGVFSGPGASPVELEADVVVTNYSRIATAMAYEQAERLPFEGFIFDESQMLRNRNTRTLFQTVKSWSSLRRPQTPAFFLSGTPIVKSAGDLWPILHMIDRARWTSYWTFVKRFAVTWEDQFGWHVEGVTNAKKLWAELAEVSMRRTVAEVQPHLPPKMRQRVPLEMTPTQARAYGRMEREMYFELEAQGGLVLAPTVLAKETRLRQLLACPRILGVEDDGASLKALVERLTDAPRSMVVFSPFAAALEYAHRRVAAATGLRTFMVRGGMTPERFDEQMTGFRARGIVGEPVVLFSTVQFGKSWSVSAVTSRIWHLGFDWNEVTMTQAEARVHRDGQADTVFAYYPVHLGSHDEDALEVLAGKRRLADVIVDRKIAWKH